MLILIYMNTLPSVIDDGVLRVTTPRLFIQAEHHGNHTVQYYLAGV